MIFGKKRLIRSEILTLFRRLKPAQYDEASFLLGISFEDLPPPTATLTERRSKIIQWSAQQRGGDAMLLSVLRELTSRSRFIKY
jgi:hypothetical protein